MKKLGRKLTCAVVLLLGVVALSVIRGTHGDAACKHPRTQNVVVSPKCESKGYTKSVCVTCGATVGKKDYKNALGHKYADATCTMPQKCSRCGGVTGQPLKHNYAAATCTAPKTCTRCQATTGKKLGHSWSAPTCTKPKTCDRCKTTTGEKLGHDWADKTCYAPKTCKRTGCNATTGKKRDHKYSKATCQEKATCKYCKKKRGSLAGHDYSGPEATCTRAKMCATKNCTKVLEYPTGEHKAATKATCKSKAKCKLCNNYFGAYGSHVAGQQATCTTQAICATCGQSYGSVKGHDYSGPAATCTSAKVCKRGGCGVKLEEASGHTYINLNGRCECTKCDYNEQHDLAPATCSAPAKCRRCGALSGSNKQHIFIEKNGRCECTQCDYYVSHDYAPATCSSPKKCRRCGALSGSNKQHIFIEKNGRCECTQCDYYVSHDYASATCTTPEKCRRCGALRGSNKQHALTDGNCVTYKKCTRSGCNYVSSILGEHNYVNNTCTICLKQEFPLGSEEYFVSLDKRARHTEFIMPDTESLVRVMMDDFNAVQEPQFVSDEYRNAFLSLFNSLVLRMYSKDIEAALSVVEGATLDALEVMMKAGITPEEAIHMDTELSPLLDKSNMTAEIHYFRNKLNKVPESLEKMMEEADDWELMSIDGSQYHMLGTDGYYNLKFVSSCKKFEAVYNKDGILLTEKNDPINMGTYNYQGVESGLAIVKTFIQHFMLDMAPYYRYGNVSPADLNQGKPIYDATAEQYHNEIKALLERKMLPSERVSEYRKIKDKYCK